MTKYSFDTRLIHEKGEYEKGAVNTPIYQTSSFSYQSAEELAAVFKGEALGYVYSRLSNPTNHAFETKITSLEEGIGAVSCASGMAAISIALLSLLEKGDELIAASSLFAGTYSFLEKDLSKWGIKTRFVEATNLKAYEETITSKTKFIFLESVGNPKLDVVDVQAISEIAHRANIPLIVDNTTMTPYLFKVKLFGADIVIHSTSKYINGSANSIGGIIVDLGTFSWSKSNINVLDDYLKYGQFAYLAKIRQDLFSNLGGCASPFNIYLNSIGLETLAVRMDKHCANAYALAKALQEDSRVKKVNYPGLENHLDYKVAKKQFAGKYGGILTIELESEAECFKVINQLNLARNLANIGDVRTLVIHPASTIYCKLSPEQQKQLGVTPGLIRIAVGIENPKDIISDFKQALNGLN